MKSAEIIAIGSELLTPDRMDTNSLYLTGSLEARGIRVVAKTIVGDDLNDIVQALRNASARAEVIVCSGGLGPTADDLTREATARFLGVPLTFHQESMDRIASRFQMLQLKITENNRSQAMAPEGSTVLPNDHGSAPGIYARSGETQIFLLPGPPFELEKMWEIQCVPLLKSEVSLHRRVFRIAMMPESKVDEMLKPVVSGLNDVRYTILTSPGQIEVQLLSSGDALEELGQSANKVRKILGQRIFSESLKTLEEVVGELLQKENRRVAVAESCTGGLLAKRFTDVPGSSAYFECGVITYSNESKVRVLGVPLEWIEKHGAVSEPVAAAMAEGIRKEARVGYGISITGVAGPDGGSDEKPVGTVFVGLANKAGTEVQKFRFPGERERVRFFSTQAALNQLRLHLLDVHQK